MLYSIGAFIVIVVLAAILAIRRYGRRRPPIFLVLATLPVLAGGAANGHWPAVVSLAVVLMAIPLLLWANARWPSEPPSSQRPG